MATGQNIGSSVTVHLLEMDYLTIFFSTNHQNVEINTSQKESPHFFMEQ